jgi:hypothetical protein
MTPPNPRIESDHDSTLRARAHPRVKVPFSRDSGISLQGGNIDSQPGTASTNSNSRGHESDQFLPHPAAYPILRMPPAPTPRSRTTQSEQIHQSYPSIRAQGEGVQSEKIKQKVRVNTFDLNTQPPILPHQVEKSATESTTGNGTGGRKLRKRSSALHLNLATPAAQTPSDRQPSTAASTVKSKGSRGRNTGGQDGRRVRGRALMISLSLRGIGGVHLLLLSPNGFELARGFRYGQFR